MQTESFRATILFGALTIILIGAYGIVAHAPGYLAAAALIAGASYATQAVYTSAAMFAGAADMLDGKAETDMLVRRDRWTHAGHMMWLATLTLALVVLAFAAVSGLAVL